MRHLYRISGRHGVDVVAADTPQQALGLWESQRVGQCDPAADTAQCEQVPDEQVRELAFAADLAGLARRRAAAPGRHAMSGHTPGKLEAVFAEGGCHYLRAVSGAPAAVAEVSDMGGEGEANAERLRDCWNALEGIDNPAALLGHLKAALIEAECALAECAETRRSDAWGNAARRANLARKDVAAALAALERRS